ncbi:PREDICTED: C-type lectin domain family 10 member A-like [Cyprinodon variegatus]|uniref:C-type lectin domain family 10 member A-like n=1 Tax=Cyprinodon variegatus TaxID=28743 RepID=UPI000742C806|nr:PREDICTED: C-type lectin domain family 10 member A-like [Cyprinodon variegatus]
MAEDDIHYASVVIKSNKQPKSEGKTAGRFGLYGQLAGCFGILSAILLLIIIGICVYFATVQERTANELNQLKSNQRILQKEIHNLTNLNNKLSSDYTNLTTASAALKNTITTLAAENHNLTLLNEELKKDRKNLSDIIEHMEKTGNELNVSRAQWSVEAYCPREAGDRKCNSCQKGWKPNFSSCYAYNDHKSSNWRNWEGAREDCRTKISDLLVVANEKEKEYLETISPAIKGITGYWIGLRAVNGKWRWIDGSDLIDRTWIKQHPAEDGHCVTTLTNKGWKSVSCNETRAWICEKKALTL